MDIAPWDKHQVKRRIRTYLIINREPRCALKWLAARRDAQNSTFCTGQRRNAAGRHFRRNPLGPGDFFPGLSCAWLM